MARTRLKMNKKAIAVATDVLSRLRYLNVKAEYYLYSKEWHGEEWQQRQDNSGLDREKDAQDDVRAYEKNCSVCALGACLLSYVRKYDNVKNDELLDICGNRHDIVYDLLSDVFSEEQLSLIESAFEQDSKGIFDTWDELVVGEGADNAIAFGKRFTDDKKRLRAICKNIVANKGNFVPPARP